MEQVAATLGAHIVEDTGSFTHLVLGSKGGGEGAPEPEPETKPEPEPEPEPEP